MAFPLLIDIKRSEERLLEIVDTVAINNNWAKEVFPGTLEQIGQTIRYKTLVISFRDISLNKPSNTFSGAHQMIGTVTFMVRLVNTDLRTHQDTYPVALEVAEEIKGKKILIFPTDVPHRVGSAWIQSFSFNQVELPNKQCYSYDIVVSSEYGAAYKVER